MAPSLWIMKDVKKQAVGLLQSGSTRDAIVMILTNDLSFSAPEVKPTNDMFDAGDMLQKALALLAQAPFTALGVPVGAPVGGTMFCNNYLRFFSLCAGCAVI
jgi:hypothetical protein